MDKQLILIGGKKQSGKDTLADMFVEDGFTKFAFADYLKNSLHDFLKYQFYTDIDVEAFSNNQKKEKYNLRFPFCENEHSLRSLMQWYGETIKEKFGKHFWIKNLVYKVLMNTTDKVVISDVRFDYEITETQKLLNDFNCYSIYVQRDTKNEDKHISENGLDEHHDLFDLVINNSGTIDDLQDYYITMKNYFNL